MPEAWNIVKNNLQHFEFCEIFKNSYAQLLTYNNWRQNQYWKNLILDKITYIKVLFYKNNHKRKNTFISLNL